MTFWPTPLAGDRFEAPGYGTGHYESIPVVDGVATLPDGRTVRVTSGVEFVQLAVIDTLYPPIAMSEDEMDAEREALLDIGESVPDVPNDPYPVQPDDPKPVEDPE